MVCFEVALKGGGSEGVAVVLRRDDVRLGILGVDSGAKGYFCQTTDQVAGLTGGEIGDALEGGEERGYAGVSTAGGSSPSVAPHLFASTHHMLRPKRDQIPNLHLWTPLHQRPQELPALTKPHRIKPIS